MIDKREILATSQQTSLTPHVVEKDYVLGWMLAGIHRHEDLAENWIFKGGTCLKKCFFETYRFSEHAVALSEPLRDVAPGRPRAEPPAESFRGTRAPARVCHGRTPGVNENRPELAWDAPADVPRGVDGPARFGLGNPCMPPMPAGLPFVTGGPAQEGT